MANFNLVSTAKFQPFSFERYIQPYQIYGQAYREQEQAIADLDTKASVWENMANEQTDYYTYKMYKKYSDDLRNAADQLAQSGLSPSSRKAMLNLKARYSKEITPIEQAYQNRLEEMKEQRAGRARGMVYEGDASVASLDRYLRNPSIRYGMANAQEGFQRVATAATALSKQLMEYGRGKKLDPYMNTWLQQHGYKATEINQAIADIQNALQGNGNVRGNNILTSILANEMQTSGVNAWKNQDARMDYYNRIAPALYQAVGQTQVGTFQDQGALMAAQLANQKELARYQKSLEQPDPTDIFKERGFSVLQTSGQEQRTKNIYNKLTATKYHNGSLAARYFGKTFNNPIKIYNEYKQQYDKQQKHNISAPSYSKDRKDAYQVAMEFIKKKYGVSDVLSAQEVKDLRAYGFTENSNMQDFRNMGNIIKQKSKEYYFGSVNLANLDVSKEYIMGEIGARNDWDKLNNTFWKMKPDGRMGESIEEIKDLKLDQNKISDVFYSSYMPDKVVLQIGGQRVYASPYVLGKTIGDMITESSQLIRGTNNITNRTLIAESALEQMSKLLGRGHNQVLGETNSKLQ